MQLFDFFHLMTAVKNDIVRGGHVWYCDIIYGRHMCYRIDTDITQSHYNHPPGICDFHFSMAFSPEGSNPEVTFNSIR